MDVTGSRRIRQDSSRRKSRRWPSPAFALCFLAVCVWLFVFRIGGDSLDPATEAEPEPEAEQPPVVYIPPPETPSPSVALIEETPEDTVAWPPAVKVKGLHVAAWYAAREDRIAEYIELCETTEVNTLVIDVKDDHGRITFLTDTQSISEAAMYIIPDIEETLTRLKSHGIYTIARIVCFRDPFWSSRYPQLAITNITGEPWVDGTGFTWLNPYNRDAWEHIAAASLEAVRVGFEEIQLDYVRFPTDGRLSDIDYGEAADEMSRAEVINEFVEYMRGILASEGVRLSADVFGIIAISNRDAEVIGQDLGLLLHSADAISPMIYPSHFANKRQNGTGQYINGVLFEAPDLEPYDVVYNILAALSRHLPEDGEHAIIRPYLQEFTASYLGEGFFIPYTPLEVAAQIQAVYDAGFDEWILWNHFSVYNPDSFEITHDE